MRKIYIALLVACLGLEPAVAAFRVYKLKLTYYNQKGQKVGKPKIVLSSLDYLQYEHYHGGYRWMRVEMIDTWYCPGDTRWYREFCPKPKVKGRAPSSLRYDPKRRTLPYNRQPVIP